MKRFFRSIDWSLFLLIFPLIIAGLLTMKSFGGASDYYFWRQMLWIGIGCAIFLYMRSINWRFFESTGFLVVLYLLGVSSLFLLFLFAETSWFEFSFFSIQPSEFMKLGVILLLAKYFSRRHVEIGHVKHILISGVYAGVPALLVFFQPDLGSAIIFFVIWLGVVIAAGISMRHLAFVFGVAAILLVVLWMFMLAPYQKARVISFLNPYVDPQGTGYNALQSQIAVGAGKFFGQGIGYGGQSRLQFLPEHETDFIFAAIAEEWGFAGSMILFFFYVLLIWHILHLARVSSENTARLFAIGFSLLIMGHFVIHVGMNVGLLPITGLPLSFVSYGGSHLITLFAGLGIWHNMYQGYRVKEGEELDVA